MNAILESIAIDVTSEQVGKAHKIWRNGEDLFLVENSKGECDEHGVIEYEVRYNSLKGFTCTCEAGQHGFASCKNFCWHVRASAALELEMRTALAEMAEKIDEDRGTGRATHALAMPAVMSIEQKWNISAFLLEGPVAKRMRKAPKELN